VTPTTTVVIATKDNPGYVVDAVESVLRGTVVPDQLIVVDQSAPLDPRVAALAREPAVEVLNPPTVGLAVAQNLAIRHATGDVVAFTDDDVFVDERWLEELTAALVGGAARSAVTGRVVAADEAGVPGGTAIALRTETEPATYRGLIRRDPLSGNSMAFLRSAFDECGLFDERLGTGTRFGSASDNDFGYRLLRAGYEIRYVPAAVVRHRAWRTPHGLAVAEWHYGRGQGAFLAKHALAGDAFARSRLRSTVAWRLRRIARRPLRRRTLGGHGDLRYLAAFASGAIQWALARTPPAEAAVGPPPPVPR
jgi:GT2 family glycosyltransferase